MASFMRNVVLPLCIAGPWIVRAISSMPTRSPNGVPLPKVMHAQLRKAPSTKRVIIVGDVHGACAA
jgi:hypothetical protein